MTDTPTNNTELIESRINKDVAAALPMSELGVVFRSMGEIMEFAKMMAVSRAAVPVIFRENPGACLAVCIKAHHLGFEPFSFASKCYFVNEQLAYEAQLINAIIIRRAPFTKRPTLTYEGAGVTRKCIVTLHFKEPDGDMVYESPEIKSITTKNSPLWTSDPDQQLAYYSVRAAARRYCPDVILGMYDQDEMAAIAAKDITPPAPAGKPRVDVAAKLAAGKPVEVTVIQQSGSEGGGGTSATTGAAATASTNPTGPEPVNGNAPPAADPPAEHQTTSETDAAPEAPAMASGGPDPFEAGILQEIRTALAAPDLTPEAVLVIRDEFAGALLMMRDETQVEAGTLFDAAVPAP